MISLRRTPRAGPYVSEQWGLEQAGHNSTGQVSKKMAKKVANQREKVLNNVGQQKSAFFFLCESHEIFRCIC